MIDRFRQYWKTASTPVREHLIASSHLLMVTSFYIVFNYVMGNVVVAKWASLALLLGAISIVVFRDKPAISLAAGGIFVAALILLLNARLYPIEGYGVVWILALPVWGLVMQRKMATVVFGLIAGLVILGVYLYKFGLDGIAEHSFPLSNLISTLALFTVVIYGVIGNYEAHDKNIQESKRNKELLLNLLTTELRSPMLGMATVTEHMKEEEGLSKAHLARLDAIGVSAKNAVTALNEILDWQAVEEGASILEELPYDILDVIQDACSVVLKSKRKGRCLIDLSPDLPARYVGDAKRIRQVLQILIRNGFHNSGSDAVRISVSQKSNGFLTLEVRDWGQGFSTDQIETLFEPKMRLEDGTGLGLAMAGKIIEFMGGQISVTSDEGVGASFVVKIRNPAVPDAPQLGDIVPAPSSKEVNILADQAVLSALIPWLDYWGCAIHTRATNKLDFNISHESLPIISPKIFSSSLQAGRVTSIEPGAPAHVNPEREVAFNMMIMEDDILLLDMMADFFSKKGFRVFKAESSGKAREHLHSQGINVFITDIRIDNDPLGLEMISYAVGMPEGSRPLICVLSGQRKHKASALEYGADLFYSKPANVQEMLEDILIKIAEGKSTAPITLAAKPT